MKPYWMRATAEAMVRRYIHLPLLIPAMVQQKVNTVWNLSAIVNSGETKRADVSISARWGFKQVKADLLRKILVKYNGQNIRS